MTAALAGFLLLSTACTNEQNPSLAAIGNTTPSSDEILANIATDRFDDALTPVATVSTITTSSAPADTEPIWVPKDRNILPLPWADFHEMKERRGGSDSDLVESSGTLRIEGKCLYLDEWSPKQSRSHEPSRWVLSLPSDLVQYDAEKGELWYHRRISVTGPFLSGDEVVVGDVYWRSTRSLACGNHRIMRAFSIEDCGYLSDRYRRACSVAAYSSTYGVLPDEANRRLERVAGMEVALAELRKAEPRRTAGWGIDQADPYARIGETFVAWLWLIGDEPPSATAQMLAAGHADVEFRSGATTSYAALQDAQQRFAEGRGTYLPSDTLGGTVERFELSEAVAGAWIDHRSNLLEIEVDTRWIPYEVASVLLTGDSDSYDDDRRPPQDELYSKIAEELQEHIDVPFSVVYGWLDHSDR